MTCLWAGISPNIPRKKTTCKYFSPGFTNQKNLSTPNKRPIVQPHLKPVGQLAQEIYDKLVSKTLYKRNT